MHAGMPRVSVSHRLLRLRGDYVQSQAAKVDKKGATAPRQRPFALAEARARQPKLLARLFMVRTQ